MSLRFVVPSACQESRRKQGLLTFAHDFRDDGSLEDGAYRELSAQLLWFNEHLRIPSELREHGTDRALSWFKPHAKKPLERMWSLAWWLEGQGQRFEVLKTQDPGQVLYQDKWQVVAWPPRNKRLPW